MSRHPKRLPNVVMAVNEATYPDSGDETAFGLAESTSLATYNKRLRMSLHPTLSQARWTSSMLGKT